jgi:hypothetical protein
MGRHHFHAGRISVLGFGLLFLSGCVAIPYVSGEVPPSAYNRNVDEQTGLTLDIGKTTRKEVLLRLGEPDKVSDEDRTFVYEGEATEGSKLWNLIVILCGNTGCFGWEGPVGDDAEYRGCRLTINFDLNGIVTGHDFETFVRKDKNPAPPGALWWW